CSPTASLTAQRASNTLLEEQAQSRAKIALSSKALIDKQSFQLSPPHEHAPFPPQKPTPRQMSSRPRSPLAGPPTPSPPFPIPLSGPIIKGFGRGSRDLGIPTANIPLAGLSVGGHEGLESGVYYGWAGLNVDSTGKIIPVAPPPSSHQSDEGGGKKGGGIYPMVMSLGWNPFYANTVRSLEIHILHPFTTDFYGARMNVLICGFVRPERDYADVEALVEDIQTDIEVARRSLEREGYQRLKGSWGEFLGRFEGEGHEGGVAT
ncbi:MAG: hypothetical protein LQ338_002042, partial [Usnochroma carphineum]